MEVRKHHRKKEDYSLRTHMIHGAFDSKKWDFNHHVVPPVSQSTAFRLTSLERGAKGFVQFASADEALSGHIPIYIYDRLDEPTRAMLEENLAYAEGGDICVTFASGMAAISGVLGSVVRQGQEVLAHQVLYGCTYSLMTNWLPRFGMQARFTNFLKTESLFDQVTPATRVLYFETPTNPTMELIDITALRRVADQVNASREERERVLVIVDNTFATPHCQRPLKLGADIVVESLTKGLGGFGTDMGGAVIAPAEWYNYLMLFRRISAECFPRAAPGASWFTACQRWPPACPTCRRRRSTWRSSWANTPKWPASGIPARSAFRRRRWLIGKCSARMESLLPAACSISFLREVIPSKARLRSWWITLRSTLIPSPWPSASGRSRL